jgi:hypothetical protein
MKVDQAKTNSYRLPDQLPGHRCGYQCPVALLPRPPGSVRISL